MRLQVRIGEQYSELLAHLEAIKPELRGKRLLALAAMQIARAEIVAPVARTNNDASALDEIKQVVESANPPASSPKRAPDWITRNANGI